MSNRPIGDHGFLSDCHSAALIDRAGSVEWLCFPRFDSPSVFARLLDDDAGHFSITPRDIVEVNRRYIDGSLVLRTQFRTKTGVVELHDALLMGQGVRGHDLGKDSPQTLARRVECTEGDVTVDVEFSPRMEYGLTTPWIRKTDDGYLARGGAASLLLVTEVDLNVDDAAATAEIELAAGAAASFLVQYGSPWEPVICPAVNAVEEAIVDTVAAWASWEYDHQRYTGFASEAVSLSGKVLQGLTYQRSGAIIAAATTSLPEAHGGNRNWDYRFSWIRDSSLTLDALWKAACPDEVDRFLNFLVTAASSFRLPGDISIMFGIEGERDLSERTLDHLEGWMGNTPVRVGNDAWRQRQLDVYGELLDAVHRLRHQLGKLGPDVADFLTRIADSAANSWQEKDQGIWEMRDEPDHHLHSKLMCWVALDRAIDLADALDALDRVEDWSRTADLIRQRILDEAWNAEIGAFTQRLGGSELDASSLLIPIVGFLDGSDRRVQGTIDAIMKGLRDDRGLVYRYQTDDGLAGTEGPFLLCTYWLAEALARASRVDEAKDVFWSVTNLANDLGLLAEEVAVDSDDFMGNFPQAFSHVGLVNAAWAIDQADS